MTQPVFPIPTPAVNPALGSDLSCVSDVTPDMREVSGRRALAEALVRRLQTPRGTLLDDQNYGFDLVGELGDDVTPAFVASLQSTIVAEVQKDERVIAARAVVQFVAPSQVAAAMSTVISNPMPDPVGVLVVRIDGQDGTGTFRLTLSVADVTVTLLEGPT